MRSSFAVVVGFALLIACDSKSPTSPPDTAPYSAFVDLTATIRQLGAEETEDVDTAIERLVGIGDAAVPSLTRAIATEPQPIRLGALEALGQIESPRAFAALVDVATTHADDEVRATAILKLGETLRAEARPALESALGHPSPMVHRTAAVACGGLCTSPGAIDRIVDIVLGDFPDIEVPRVRNTLIGLLSGSDAAAAAHARESIRARTAPLLGESTPADLRARAILLAADAGLPNAEPLMLAVIRDAKSPAIRAGAANWLGKNGSPDAVPALLTALADPLTRPGAAIALQAMVRRDVTGAREAIATLHDAAPVKPAAN